MKLYIDNDVVAHQSETPKQMAEVFQRIDDDQPVFISLEDAGSELCLNPNDVATLARAFLAQERVVKAARAWRSCGCDSDLAPGDCPGSCEHEEALIAAIDASGK